MTQGNATRSGTAIVTLRGSRHQYEGHVDRHGPWVDFSGQRRVLDGVYRDASDHTWPHHEIASIKWLEQQS